MIKLLAIFAVLVASAVRATAAPAPTSVGALPSPRQASTSPFEAINHAVPENRVDALVFARLRSLGIIPANPCSDAVFLRRVYLDVIGTLPTAQEARDFLADQRPNKRQVLIDRLLERDEFVEYWTMKWCDLLRVKAEFPVNLWPNAVQAYHQWIHAAVRANRPYDQFARELLTATGSNFRSPAVNFYRAAQSHEPQALAQMVALMFMGSRTDAWPKERLAGMAEFFAYTGYKSTLEWKEEIVFFDAPRAATRPAARAIFPDGRPAALARNRDPRQDFADWLVSPENPYFARSMANRVWFWLLGRGIVHEPDDMRPDNPPENPELLALLEKELIAAKFDGKALFRLILNSRTYQLSSLPASRSAKAAANFASYPVRRLDAEVLIDAICQVTGTSEKYSSPIPEPFTFIPEGQRSIALADGSITSPFLVMFGRPPRDSGLELERTTRITSAQRLHLLNSSHIQRKLEQGSLLQTLAKYRTAPVQAADELYLTVLSRHPTPDELRTLAGYMQTNATTRGSVASRQATVDIAWALINSTEFLYRH